MYKPLISDLFNVLYVLHLSVTQQLTTVGDPLPIKFLHRAPSRHSPHLGILIPTRKHSGHLMILPFVPPSLPPYNGSPLLLTAPSPVNSAAKKSPICTLRSQVATFLNSGLFCHNPQSTLPTVPLSPGDTIMARNVGSRLTKPS